MASRRCPLREEDRPGAGACEAPADGPDVVDADDSDVEGPQPQAVGTEDEVAEKGDRDERRAEERQARHEGRSPSGARVTTGASKQPRRLSAKKAAKANVPLHERKGKS